jgi:hypothetical protein
MAKVICLIPRLVLQTWKTAADWQDLQQAQAESQRRIIAKERAAAFQLEVARQIKEGKQRAGATLAAQIKAIDDEHAS